MQQQRMDIDNKMSDYGIIMARAAQVCHCEKLSSKLFASPSLRGAVSWMQPASMMLIATKQSALTRS